MASRVNTKFVVILIVAIVAMLGAVFGAYMVVHKSAAELAAMGDQAAAEGDWTTARRRYARAVNRDNTKIEYTEKWIDALGHWLPETEAAYTDAFYSSYMLAIQHAADVQRTNVEAYERELDLRMEMMLRTPGRGYADAVIERTSAVLRFFDGVPGVDERWPVLRRYRGIAWQKISERDELVDAETYDLVREDLEAALAADPSDDRARAALMRWIVFIEQEQLSDATEDYSGLLRARAESIAMGEAHLEAYPDSPLVATVVVAQQVNTDRFNSAQGLIDSERSDAIRAALESNVARVDNLFSSLMEMPPEKINFDVLGTFQLLETLTDPGGMLYRSLELIERMIDADPQDAGMVMMAAGLQTGAGDSDAALAYYERVETLETPALSLRGLRLFELKRSALINSTTLLLDKHAYMKQAQQGTQEERDAMLQRAIEKRDAFAARVAEDENALILIDGRVSLAKGDTDNALRLFKRFNEQTQSKSSAGLWQEAVAARELNQLGTARDALEALIVVDPNNMRARLMLADIEIRLQEFVAARRHYEYVLVFDSGNAIAREGLANINALENPDLVEDPIIGLILKARQLRRGTEDTPGDLSSAIELLSNGIESVDYAPEVTRELASLLLDAGDVTGARDLMARAIEANPEEEGLKSMQQAMMRDDPVDILVAMIEANESDPVERDIAIATVAIDRGREDLLSETVDRLLESAPERPEVVDLAFVRALEVGDVELARRMADRAAQGNMDRVNGLSYRARVAAYEGDHEQAVQLLEQAQALGTADSAVLRMLGIERRAIGLINESINAFEQSLAVRPDDQRSILEYMGTLIGAGRYTDALDVARRFQRYAMDNQAFLNAWLTLESQSGEEEGVNFAIKQREKFLQLNPNDLGNKEALAGLYISAEQWDNARALIDELRAGEDQLRYAVLEAQWYANQGRVERRSGLGAAREVLNQYIASQGDDVTAAPYIALARFMLERGRPDLAVQAAASAVEREDPETLDGTKLYGDLLLNLNQYSNAAAAYRKVVSSGADENDQYRLRLVDMLIRTRQFDEAQRTFDALSDENKSGMIQILQHAEIVEGRGDTARARELLDQAVAQYSDNPIVYIKRAEFLSGDESTMTDMLADIDAALQISPDDWRAFRVRAAGYFAVDRRSEALDDLKRAVRLNPSLDQALFGILNEMMIDGRSSEAFDFAREIIAMRPRDTSLVNSLGQLFASRGDWEHATDLYKVVWDMQRSPTAGSTLIDAIARTRNPDTALANAVINDLTEIAGDINQSPGLLAAQALVLRARGRDELALQQLTKAFDLSVNSDDLLVQWSGNLSRLFEDGTTEEQIRYLQNLKRRNSNREVLNWLDLFIAQRLVYANIRAGEAEDLLEQLTRASSQPKLQLTAFQSWGSMLYARQDYNKAAEIWKRGAEIFTDDWELSNNLAYVLSEELDRPEEALGLAESAVSLNPDRSEPYDTIARVYTSLERYDEAKQMIDEGMRFALSVRSRVTLLLAETNMELAQGDVASARSKMVDIRSLMRAMPTRYQSLDDSVEEMQGRIDSAG